MKDVEEFRAWLVETGAQILAPTNQYEVLRYVLESRVHIVYRRATGTLTWTGGAASHYQLFQSGDEAQIKRPNRPKGDFRKKLVRQLLERDGDDCWLCGLPLGLDVTLEHLLALDHGGRNNRSNCALVHGDCNRRMGNKAVADKVALRDQVRAGVPVQHPVVSDGPPLTLYQRFCKYLHRRVGTICRRQLK